jgi:chitodextrinase
MTASQVGRTTVTWRPRLGDQVFGEECSATVDVVPDADAPTAPSGLRASVQSQSSVQLLWTAATDNVGVKGYRVWRSTDGTAFTKVADVSATNATDGGLAVNTPYWYRVDAYDAGGNVSPPSAAVQVKIPDITAPSPPSGLTVSGRGPGRIDLAWAAATDNVGVDRYRIYRRAGLSAPFTLVGETAARTYRDSGLALQVYSYYVTALDRAGNESARSNMVSDRPGACAPGAPCL